MQTCLQDLHAPLLRQRYLTISLNDNQFRSDSFAARPAKTTEDRNPTQSYFMLWDRLDNPVRALLRDAQPVITRNLQPGFSVGPITMFTHYTLQTTKIPTVQVVLIVSYIV